MHYLGLAAERCPPLLSTHVPSHLEHPVGKSLLGIEPSAGDLRKRGLGLIDVNAGIFIDPDQPLANLAACFDQLFFLFFDTFDGIEHS